MKNRLPRVPALFLLLPWLFSGCVFFQSSETFYYLFEYPPEVPVELQEAAIAGTLGVEEPEVSPVFERRQIVRRVDGPQLTFLSNDLWAVTPSSGVQDLLLERLRASGLFAVVEPESRELEPAYLVVPRLDRLELDESGETPRARVSLELSFREAVTGEVLLTVAGRRERELREATAYRFAVAVNEILGEEIDALIEEIDRWSGG
jgi:ABC-type uncharacterized transport system auxiliary subunit